MRYCSTCGASFTPRREYYHQCWSCWRAENVSGRRTSDDWLAGYAAGIAAGRLEPRTPPLDAALIMRLVRLCHPDKHPPDRFAECNAVTARLLALREGRAA
jgi:hypothetical protein